MLEPSVKNDKAWQAYYACWALSFLIDGSNDKYEMVISTGVVPTLVKHLSNKNVTIVTPLLRSIGNIVTSNDEQTQLVIEHGTIAPLWELFYHQKTQLVRGAAWAVSNIAAGPANQIHALIEADLVLPVVDALAKGDFVVQKEAVWFITNYTSRCNIGHIFVDVVIKQPWTILTMIVAVMIMMMKRVLLTTSYLKLWMV